MNGAPGIPTDWGGGSAQVDDTMQFDPLNSQLNSVVQIPYSNISVQPSPQALLYYKDVGLYDWQYNTGYKQQAVDNQVSVLPYHYESPDVPVTHTPFMEQLFNSTLVYENVGGRTLFQSLRAPAVNEGFTGN